MWLTLTSSSPADSSTHNSQLTRSYLASHIRTINLLQSRVEHKMVSVALAFLVFASSAVTSEGGFFGRGNAVKTSSNDYDDSGSRPLLPKPTPHEDSCYLLEFHTDNNDMVTQMEPVLQRLEEDLDTKVRRINIFRRKEFMGLLEAIGFDECGSIPFYYNRRTGQAICGPTSYLNLKRWGTGDLKHMFQDPPENLHEQEPDFVSSRRDVGFKGFFTEKMRSLENKGKAKAERQTAKKAEQKADKGAAAVDKQELDGMSAADRTAARRLARKANKEASV